VGTLHNPDWSLMQQHGYTASTDMPVALYVAELKKLYPRAKFILTTRSSPEQWFTSWSTLIQSVSLLPRFAPWVPRVAMIDRYNRWLLAHMHHNDSFLSAPHPLHLQMDPQVAMNAYSRHNALVRRHFMLQPRRLLDYHMGSGWEPLCSFLNKPVPSVPFPQSNSSATVQLQLTALVVLANLGVCVVLWLVLKLLNRVFRLPSPLDEKKRHMKNEKEKKRVNWEGKEEGVHVFEWKEQNHTNSHDNDSIVGGDMAGQSTVCGQVSISPDACSPRMRNVPSSGF